MNGSAVERVHGTSLSFIQWRIQGRGPGAPAPPLFLDQTRARRVEKIFLETFPPPLSKVLVTFYFSKYINSHDSFYWQIFHEPLTLDIFMHIKSTFLRLRPVQKNIS